MVAKSINPFKKAKIAIAIPVYNGEATLERALQCIASQEYENFQAYIFENKSTDNSLEIAEAFCKKDPRFKVVKNDQHLNIIENFAHSIQFAANRAEYFCLRACDDMASSDYISKLVGALEKTNLNFWLVQTLNELLESW